MIVEDWDKRGRKRFLKSTASVGELRWRQVRAPIYGEWEAYKTKPERVNRSHLGFDDSKN